jgi:predicted phage-related endonuclease
MYPFAHANVDRMIVGENAILECKTTSVLNMKKFKGTEFPEHYYAQCVHYMMVVPSCERVYLAVLILGKEFKIYVLERDEEEIAALAKAEEEFFENHIKKGVAPPVDGSQASSDALSAVYAAEEAEEVDISPLDSVLDSYGILTAQIKVLEEQREKLCNEVKQRMQTAQRGESARYVVSWASSERRTFDQKKFRAQFENVNLDQYYKVTKVRTFKVTQKVG